MLRDGWAMTRQTFADEHAAALMRAAQDGDEAAYLELLQIITPYLRRIVAYRWTFAGREDVEDLVQDVLLSLHAVRATYDPRRPFTPWLLAIVRHRLADGARRHARKAAHEVPLEPRDVTFPDTSANLGTDPLSDTLALQHAIHALPRGQRNAIELLKLQGLSLREAATATGTTVGALKVATHRAMAALRAMLRGTARS
jgi:RNA polymerase sigma-70 factor (ECF subfamily)